MALVSPALDSVSSLSYILATIYAASMLNVWLWNLIKHEQHMVGLGRETRPGSVRRILRGSVPPLRFFGALAYP